MAAQTSPTINRSKLRRIEKAIREVGLTDPAVLAAEIVKLTDSIEGAKRYLDHLYRRRALTFDELVGIGHAFSAAPDEASLLAHAEEIAEAEYDRLVLKRAPGLDASLMATTEKLQAAFWAEVDRRGIDRALVALWCRIWAYFRVSSDDYRRSTSPTDQMNTTAIWCVDEMVFPDRAFHEHAHSAWAEKGEIRPVLNAMLALIRTGDELPDNFAGLVVLHTDRLARDVEMGMHIVKLLRKRGYGLWESDGGSKTDLNELVDIYLAKFRQAERESEIKQRKIKNKYRNLLRAGRVIGCYANSFGQRVRWGKRESRGGGFERFQEKIVEHPTEAPLVRQAGQRILGGEMPFHVAVDFNDHDVRGRNMREFVERPDGTVDEVIVPGGRWNATRLCSVLTSPRMIGHVRYDGELWDCTGMLTPLFARVEWERLCQIFGVDPVSGLKIDSETGEPLPKPQRSPEGRLPTTIGSSILICPTCNSSMALSTDPNGVQSYRCTKRHLRDVSRMHCEQCGERMQRVSRDGSKRLVCKNGHQAAFPPTTAADGQRHPTVLKTIADALITAVVTRVHTAVDAQRLAEEKAKRFAGQSSSDRVAQLNRELADLDAQDEAINQLFVMRRYNRQRMEQEAAKVAATRRAKRKELAELGHGNDKHGSKGSQVDPQTRWEQATISQQRQMILDLVEHILAPPPERQGAGSWANREAGFRFIWKPGVTVPERMVELIAQELYEARIEARRSSSPRRTPEEIDERAYELHKQGLTLPQIVDAFEREGVMPANFLSTGNPRWSVSSVANAVHRGYARHGEDYYINRECYPQAARELALAKKKDGRTYGEIAAYLNRPDFKHIRRPSGKSWTEAAVGHLLSIGSPRPGSVGGRTPSVPDDVCLLLLERFELGETAGQLAHWLKQRFPHLRPRTSPDAALDVFEWKPEQIYGLINRGRRLRH